MKIDLSSIWLNCPTGTSLIQCNSPSAPLLRRRTSQRTRVRIQIPKQFIGFLGNWHWTHNNHRNLWILRFRTLSLWGRSSSLNLMRKSQLSWRDKMGFLKARQLGSKMMKLHRFKKIHFLSSSLAKHTKLKVFTKSIEILLSLFIVRIL